MSVKLNNKQENEKVKLAIIQLYDETKAFKEAEELFAEKKKKLNTYIKNFMFTNNISSIKFLAQAGNFFGKENKKLEVKEVTRKKVIFDVEKLRAKMDSDLFSEIVDKKYEVSDMQGLIKYLKTLGVNPKKFKTFIAVVETVNNKKINELSELGDITEKDIKGCYEVKEENGYIKINILEE